MNSFESPFLAVPAGDWLCSNDLAFAIFDGFPVSPGHVLITTRRVIANWFDATPAEQAAMMSLVNEAKGLLDELLHPKPDAYNVGFNSGVAAGQTVPHVHIHVIPRYHGDIPDPRGGVRHVIPGKGNYLSPAGTGQSHGTSLSLSAGPPHSPLWRNISQRVCSAREVDLLASFIQPSGLDLIQQAIFAALRAQANIRILVGDYLYITSAEALARLVGWTALASEIPDAGTLQVRLAEISKIPSRPESFHPKAWRIMDSSGGLWVVGSSNLSKAALETGIEWNLIGKTNGSEPIDAELAAAFSDIWSASTPLDDTVVSHYAEMAKASRRKFIPPESLDSPAMLHPPRPWQISALESLARIRADRFRRALVAVATGLGKTWLAGFDALAVGRLLDRLPRVLVIAHRAEILVQAEATLRAAMQSQWDNVRVSWYLGTQSDISGDLVVASVQKLARPEGLAILDAHRFDYVVIDEVHHAQAPTYRRVMARMKAGFVLGLTATPERTDGIDIASLFDDVLAWQATVGDGIVEGSLVPFHYVGLKDDVDFEQIPWRNGRFETSVLEQSLENSARMDRLWTAWQEDPASRTIVFCCSRRHALYARDWLKRRGVLAAAVFSGVGGDPRSESLDRFSSGTLDALCVVDLFNEGLDVPNVDRVVMLRPTESKVVFLQQLGRGLRAAENKLRLKVIDFVGNHRVFASRITHLLSMGGRSATWSDLRKFLDGAAPDLPPGCLLDLEIEAKEIMSALVPKSGSAVEEAYRCMRDELGRRPAPSELFHHGYLPRTLSSRHGSWFDFIAGEDDLTTDEMETLRSFESWFTMLETTHLNKCYKMVVLRVMLDRDALWSGIGIEALAVACRDFLIAHPILRNDLPPTRQFADHATAPAAEWADWWLSWPLERWMSEQAGRKWFKRDGDNFVSSIQCPAMLRASFEAMTFELVDYRLAHYAKSRIERTGGGTVADRFTAKVSHSGGKPILPLPTIEELPGRPMGPVNVRLPNGSEWLFRFVKIACNVAAPVGREVNQLPQLLREWFGDTAGAPGTDRHVTFVRGESGWSVEPILATGSLQWSSETQESVYHPTRRPSGFIEHPQEDAKYTRLVPVYSLEAAAGLWGPENSPEETGWTEVPGVSIKPGMFVARVRGRSMEPKIADGSWNLFRPCPLGSREGRIVLVQFNSLGDPEHGGRFTVKKYHSRKTHSEGRWRHELIELQPLNPEFQPIVVDAHEGSEMTVVGEWVATLED